MASLDDRNKLVKKEIKRLSEIFKDIPVKKKKTFEGLIVQAARLRILLDENWIDITENGDYDMFNQSDKTDPYERKRPVADLYNNRDTAYQRVIKQLADYLPDDTNVDLGPSSNGSDLI